MKVIFQLMNCSGCMQFMNIALWCRWWRPNTAAHHFTHRLLLGWFCCWQRLPLGCARQLRYMMVIKGARMKLLSRIIIIMCTGGRTVCAQFMNLFPSTLFPTPAWLADFNCLTPPPSPCGYCYHNRPRCCTSFSSNPNVLLHLNSFLVNDFSGSVIGLLLEKKHSNIGTT